MGFIHEVTKKTGHYKFTDIAVRLPKHDTDITLTMPNGEQIIVQWRVEGPSLDICLPKEEAVNNWKGDEMAPAPAYKEKHVRMAKQLMIPLSPDVLGS